MSSQGCEAVTLDNHLAYLQIALIEARKSPPKSTNYSVGALLLDPDSSTILSTGYTLELPGNTHAEQCALYKYATAHGVREEELASVLPEKTVIYVTMEPCHLRLSGNLPCVDRLIQAKVIRKVYFGVGEPEKFVGENEGRTKLNAAGIECIYVPGLEEEILSVATAGHHLDKE